MYTLHDHSKTSPDQANGWSISRYRWFLVIFGGAFAWYWIPGWLFQALSVFAFPTFIAPNNAVVNQVFGGWTGLGLLPITLDWTQISGYASSPLIPPWHALANTMIGVIIFYIIGSAGIHFGNVWYGHYLPFSDSSSWDNTQHHYNVSRIVTPERTLDLAEYENYSPLFLSTTYAMAYGLSFASMTALVFSTVLFHGKEIWLRLRDTKHSLDDVHSVMMRKYKQVPDWWFAALFLPSFGLAFVTAYVWRETELSWWAIIVAFLVAFFWVLPIGIVQATTNIQLGLNVFAELVIGYMQPGRPTAMMMFKTYGYIACQRL